MQLGVVKAVVENGTDRYGFIHPFFRSKEIYLRYEYYRGISEREDKALIFVPPGGPPEELEVGAPIVFESIEGEGRRKASAWSDFVAFAWLQVPPECREEFRQLRLASRRVAKLWLRIKPASAEAEPNENEAQIIDAMNAEDDLRDWADECIRIGVPLQLVTFLLWASRAV